MRARRGQRLVGAFDVLHVNADLRFLVGCHSVVQWPHIKMPELTLQELIWRKGRVVVYGIGVGRAPTTAAAVLRHVAHLGRIAGDVTADANPAALLQDLLLHAREEVVVVVRKAEGALQLVGARGTEVNAALEELGHADHRDRHALKLVLDAERLAQLALLQTGLGLVKQ